MRRYSLVLFLLFSQTGLFGQFSFIKHYPFHDWHSNIVGIHILNDGGYMLSGQSVHHYPYSHNARLDSDGKIIWEKDIRLLGIEYKIDAATDHGKFFFESGYTSGSPFQDWGDAYLTCHDIDGQTLWTKIIDVANTDILRRLSVSSNGDVWGIGAYVEVDSFNKSFVVKYDIEGNLLWQKKFDDSASVVPSDILSMPNGDTFCGISRGANSSRDHVPQLLRLDRDGNIILKRSYQTELGWDPFHSMSLLSNGNILCTGRDSTMREFNQVGDLIRSNFEGDLRNAFELIDGNILCFGNNISDGSFWVKKRNTDWKEVWFHKYSFDGNVWIYDVKETDSGDLVMAGSISNGVIFDETAILIRTDCEGNLIHSQACQPLHVIHEYALWPNPATNQAAISIPKELREKKHSMKVFDNLGRLIHSQDAEPHAGRMFLDVESFLPGVYYVDVQAENEKASIFKLVVSR